MHPDHLQLTFDDFDVIRVETSQTGTELLDAPTMVYPMEFTEVAFTSLQRPPISEGSPVHNDITSLPTADKVERAIQAITKLLLEKRPLSVAYSGGKDSSVMAALTLEAARRLQEQGAKLPPILFTHARTGVDNPAVDMVAKMEIERIRQYAASQSLPVRVDITEPALNDSWAVRIISGRALPTFANSSSRDCAISWKLVPQKRQRKAAMKELKASGKPVVLIGTRFEESTSRAARMNERGELDTEVWSEEIINASGKVTSTEDRLSPIAFWTQEDIWVFLSELSSGERTSYTDAKDLWDIYRDGGNTSCAVVSDDVMKANAKACGARFGCALCVAVGRDKSLEAMLESDEKYNFLVPLNHLQRFMVDTQYDMSRRMWLGRTIQDDGYIAIAPDVYSPAMQRELLSYALTVDRDEKIAARKLGIAPRFELISMEQLLAIDCIWSIQGHQPRAFEAIHIWESIYEHGKSFRPPAVDPTQFDKKIPKPRWLHVGHWDSDPGFNSMYSGARNLMADFTGATESGGCMHNMVLGDGRVVMAIETSDLFDISTEGTELFIAFEVLEDQIHKKYEDRLPSEAFRHYQMLGTVSTSKRHVGLIDDMLRRTAWKERHGVFSMTIEDLLHRSVSSDERAAGVKCPEGQLTLAEELAVEIAEMHEARERTRFRA